MTTMTRFSRRRFLDVEVQVSRQMAAQNPDIVWSGDAYVRNKQLKHYPSFCKNETNKPVFVWTKYLGYVEDLCEDQNGDKMVKSTIITLPRGNRGPNSKTKSTAKRSFHYTYRDRNSCRARRQCDSCCLLSENRGSFLGEWLERLLVQVQDSVFISKHLKFSGEEDMRASKDWVDNRWVEISNQSPILFLR
ncbi:hypothetical protein ABFX02_13G134800 [Erythranthe guttata]